MEQKVKTNLWRWLLGLVLMLGLMMGISAPAMAQVTPTYIEVETWSDLQSKITNSSEANPAYLKLKNNITATASESYLQVASGKSVHLDLNGKTLSRGLTSAVNNGYVIGIEFGGELTLLDSSSEQTGTITGGFNGNPRGGGVNVNGGTFTMSGGTIQNNTSYAGGGVFVEDGGTFTMEDGTIQNNTATGLKNSPGGGVYVWDGTFTMRGGTIKNNTAIYGGGVWVDDATTFTMTGGTIEGNTATDDGGGVVNAGTLTLEGNTLSITGNKVREADNNVYLPGNTIQIGTAGLSPKSPIGVTLEDKSQDITSNGNYTDDAAAQQVFVSDDPAYEVYRTSGSQAALRKLISYTVTFKVANGAWNDGKTDEQKVTLKGYEGDELKLSADQIPAVGSKPDEGYKAGKWDTEPKADTVITADTTYTYTYAQKETISATVTFKVVNGAWNDATAADQTVTLTGKEGDELKLKAEDIPAVGEKPAEGYKAGAWDVTPNTETAITEDTIYTYTYTQDEAVEKVIDMINALPDSADVKATDKDAIEAARKAYDALTDEQKAQVPKETLKKLTDDEEALQALSQPTVYFRSHIQNLAWDKQLTKVEVGKSESVGTTGRSLRLEALDVLVPEGFSVTGFAHLQNLGDTNVTKIDNPDFAVPEGYTVYRFGTTGQSRRLEALSMGIVNAKGEYVKGLRYTTHLQNYSWQGYVRNGSFAGTRGMSLRLEAIRFAYGEE